MFVSSTLVWHLNLTSFILRHSIHLIFVLVGKHHFKLVGEDEGMLANSLLLGLFFQY